MKKREKVVEFLLPPDEQASESVHPTVGSLTDPPSGSVSRQAQISFLLAPTFDVVDHLHESDQGSNVRIVVAFVCAKVLRLLVGRQGRKQRHALKNGFDLRFIVAVRSRYDETDWKARRFGKKMPFCAFFAPICGIGAGLLSPKRGFQGVLS